MGFFDGWINSLMYATGLKKKTPPKYVDTNEDEFIKSIPEKQAFVVLTSVRSLNPFKGGFSRDDFAGGGIQGVGGKHSKKGGSYWIHTAIGYKHDGIVEIIESLDKITRRGLDFYFKPNNQLKLFFPPITKEQSKEIWERALTKEGNNYDYLDILGHISILEKIGLVFWGDPKLFVCGEFARWAFKPYYNIMNPKIPDQRGAPKDINDWLQPNPDVKLMVYNMDPKIHN